jgi:dolichol-phosphate mannosyltransferase
MKPNPRNTGVLVASAKTKGKRSAGEELLPPEWFFGQPLSYSTGAILRQTIHEKARGVSLVIPAKNESRTISDTIKGGAPFVDEILVVDGHSRDATKELAEKLGCRVVLDGGKGKGDGVRTGIYHATGSVLVFIDGDGSHEPRDIPKLVQPLLDGKADLVIASRVTGGSDETTGSFSRRVRSLGSYLLTLAINLRWHARLTDCQNGFRAIKAAVASELDLREDLHTIEEEMVLKCLQKGYLVTQVPSHEYARKYGASTLDLKRTWHRFVWCLLKHSF